MSDLGYMVDRLFGQFVLCIKYALLYHGVWDCSLYNNSLAGLRWYLPVSDIEIHSVDTIPNNAGCLGTPFISASV